MKTEIMHLKEVVRQKKRLAIFIKSAVLKQIQEIIEIETSILNSEKKLLKLDKPNE